MTGLMKISFNVNNKCKTDVIIASELLKDSVKTCLETRSDINDNTFHVLLPSKSPKEAIVCNSSSVLRLLSRIDSRLYGKDLIERTQIDNWLTITEFGLNDQRLDQLNQIVVKSEHLVANQLSFADICVRNQLIGSNSDLKSYPNLKTWIEIIDQKIKSFSKTKSIAESTSNKSIKTPKMGKNTKTSEQSANSKPQKTANKSSTDAKEEGKYTELPNAVNGEVVVRFPPEASGFLHIGHAKAALLNHHYSKTYNGKLILRFDDTNPEKEKEDFEKVILEDVKMLKIDYQLFSYTSDHFETLLAKCEELLRLGKAYVDDTAPEVMKTEREKRVESKNWNNSVEKNLQMWTEMKNGSEYGQKCCVRAKIDMSSDNGCLRDPAMYRCKNQKHPRTGHKYKVYPTYDFACPIVDSIEGVTHALRTSEYLDRDAQFYWFIDALGLRKPTIWAYSRLNMMNTVLSKRKLTFFVEEGIVEGWDDPRMPTVRGVLRRGLSVDGLRQFIIAQGSSRSVVFMDWDKIWAFNKKVIDPIAGRYSAVEKSNSVVVNIVDEVIGNIEVSLHPKNPELGKREVKLGKQILIDQTDAQLMSVSDVVTFINWGNLLITAITKDPKTGFVTDIKAKLNLENKDFKKTLKVTWIEANSTVPAILTYFEHIISKPVLKPEDDFKTYMNRDTKLEVQTMADCALKGLKRGDVIQIQRKGFFICDSVYDESTTRFTGKPAPVILLSIPDGSTDVNIFPKSVQEWKKKTQELSQTQDKTSNKTSTDLGKLLNNIKECGESVRQLKANKAPKEQITEKVSQLLKLKEEFKKQSGMEWKADIQLSAPKVSESPSNDAQRLDALIRAQGDTVRKLKADKAAKDVVTDNVNKLLELKKEFKKTVGKDWTQDMQFSQTVDTSSKPTNGKSAQELDALIRAQGDTVRKLKADKAAKDVVTENVNKLLELKKEFKKTVGKDWTQDMQFSQTVVKQLDTSSEPTKGKSAQDLDAMIRAQGALVRKLKADKVPKDLVNENVKKLLELKEEFKKTVGKEWKEDIEVIEKKTNQSNDNKSEELSDLVQRQADSVRSLKAEKADKSLVDESVKKLLELKAEYKRTIGAEWVAKPQSQPQTSKPQTNSPKAKEMPKKAEKTAKTENKSKTVESNSKSNPKRQTRLGVETKKGENTAEWYTEVITKGEMIEYYDVSGCYILRPWAYAIWETIQAFFDAKIKGLGVENCYFPMFISKSALETEKTHIADFAPEVAWVTKSGQSDLAEPIAIRPTSETVMYPSYAKWVQSHRDLPIKLNQWCSVVRWEFKTPTPFLRTREFLWQEGHSAFATKEEALEEVYQILDFYAQVYENLLAIPVIKGRKTEKEKFAGGEMTTTCEAYVGTNGRGIQGATSHFLGQNFSKMFDIVFEDPQEIGQKRYAYQNSWGLSTRSIGAVVMIHGDDKGLVLPPRVAKVQVIIVLCGITANTTDEDKNKLIDGCKQLEQTLRSAGIKVKCDLSDHYSPGWKFNHWELKGVPIRVEFGPKDQQKGEYVAVRRDNGQKMTHKLTNCVKDLTQLLDQIHDNLYKKAKEERDSHLIVTQDWKEFLTKLDQKFIIMSPFCGGKDCEEQIKKESAKEDVSDASGPLMGAKSLCIPLEQPKPVTDDMKCIFHRCLTKPQFFTLFGRSY